MHKFPSKKTERKRHVCIFNVYIGFLLFLKKVISWYFLQRVAKFCYSVEALVTTEVAAFVSHWVHNTFDLEPKLNLVNTIHVGV